MSDLPPPPPGPPPPPPPPGPSSDPYRSFGGECPSCGAPVAPDQDWCLNCGAALTTEVAGAGGWRTPVAIVSAVLLVAAAALVFAFVELSGEADRVASSPETPLTGPTAVAPTPTPTPTTTPTAGLTGATGPTGSLTGPTGATPTPTATADGDGIGRWPEGETAFTVILFSETTRSSAESKARTVSSLPNVGILDSSRFSSLRGGYWVVFSDQYDTLEQAEQAAESATSQAPGAYPKEVVPK